MIYLVLSCTLSHEKKRMKEMKKVVNEWYGKQIILPDSLTKLKESVLYPVETNTLKTNNLKILTIVSGECSSCIETLSKWELFIDSINTFSKVQLIVIVETTDISHFLSNYLSFIPDNIQLYFDVSLNLLLNNKLPNDWTLRTFLLDKSNSILLIGNPIYNRQIYNLYLNRIKEYESTNAVI